jgi:hypothetical protein
MEGLKEFTSEGAENAERQNEYNGWKDRGWHYIRERSALASPKTK